MAYTSKYLSFRDKRGNVRNCKNEIDTMDSDAGYKTLHVVNTDGTERQYGLIKTGSLWGAWKKNPDGSGSNISNISDNCRFYSFRKSALNYRGDDEYFYVLPCITATASTKQTATWDTSEWDEFSDSDYSEFEGFKKFLLDRNGLARIEIEFPQSSDTTVYVGTDCDEMRQFSCADYKMRIIYDIVSQRFLIQNNKKTIFGQGWITVQTITFFMLGEADYITILIDSESDVQMDVNYWEYTYD